MENLFKKLKEKDCKKYQEEILNDIERKRMIVKGWILNNGNADKKKKTKKRRRKPLTKKKI